MRVWLVVALVACSHPASSPHAPPPPSPPSDAAVAEQQPENVTQPVADAKPDRQPNWGGVGRGFDWPAIRKTVERSRIDRKGQPPHDPCISHANGEVCELSRQPLAARARVVEYKASFAVVALDVGSEDGVSEYHWAAVVDSAGKPVTKYGPVEGIRKRECTVRLSLDKPIADMRVVVLVDPPNELKARNP